MAIQSRFTSKYGVTFDTAYAVIGRLNYNKFAKSGLDNLAKDTSAEAWVFADSTARQSGAEPVGRVAVNFDVAVNGDENYVTQAYETLKVMAEFAEAVDV